LSSSLLQDMSSTKTLKNILPKYVKHFAERGSFPTKEVLYSYVREHQKLNPFEYGNSKWTSTYGSLRSLVSDIVRNKPERILKNIHSFEKEGVQYFFTDIQQVFNKVETNSNIELIDFESPSFRKHVEIQYMVADMGIYAGFKTYVATTDTQYPTSFGGTIKKLLNGQLEKKHPSDDGYWLDLILTDGQKIFNGEVEESTNVIKGLERLMDCQRKNSSSKSFVISSVDQYKAKFDKLIQQTYCDLNCVFLTCESIELLYTKVKIGDEFKISPKEMKKLLVKLFSGYNI
jgi:hypothetical protein